MAGAAYSQATVGEVVAQQLASVYSNDKIKHRPPTPKLPLPEWEPGQHHDQDTQGLKAHKPCNHVKQGMVGPRHCSKVDGETDALKEDEAKGYKGEDRLCNIRRDGYIHDYYP